MRAILTVLQTFRCIQTLPVIGKGMHPIANEYPDRKWAVTVPGLALFLVKMTGDTLACLSVKEEQWKITQLKVGRQTYKPRDESPRSSEMTNV